MRKKLVKSKTLRDITNYNKFAEMHSSWIIIQVMSLEMNSVKTFVRVDKLLIGFFVTFFFLVLLPNITVIQTGILFSFS